MAKRMYTMKSKVWPYPGPPAGGGGWYFLTLPKKESGEIKKNFEKMVRGWRSIKIQAAIGKTKWLTSIFPDSRAGAYLLPLKKEIRKKEGIETHDIVIFTIEIRV